MTFSIAARDAATGMFGMAIASSSPAVADRSTWWAYRAAGAWSAASAAAARAWAPSRHQNGIPSYTTVRTIGCRKRNRRGASVGRIRSARTSSSSASSANG